MLSVDKWGLDPMFKTFPRLFIDDILKMEPYPIEPGKDAEGVFAYKNHPINNVDVVGMIISVHLREKCNIYNVGDGTGVIPCVCWKPEPPNMIKDLPPQLCGKISELCDHLDAVGEGYSAGDMLHVRGKIKTYCGSKELVCSYHAKLTDPNMETAHMLKQVSLYEEFYDKNFDLEKFTESVQKQKDDKQPRQEVLQFVQEQRPSILDMGCLKEFLKEKGIDIALLDPTLKSLEEEGYFYPAPNKKSLLVVDGNIELPKTTLSILKRECAKPKYEDRGCHLMHILDELRVQLTYAHLQKPALKRILDKLEENSEIIGLGNHCYRPVDNN